MSTRRDYAALKEDCWNVRLVSVRIAREEDAGSAPGPGG